MASLLRNTVRVSLAVLFVGFTLSLGAQGVAAPAAAGPFLGAPFQATVAELRAASSAQPADQEFEAQILLEEVTYRVAADGSHSYAYRLIFRVDSTQGVNDWAEMSMQWDPWNDKPAELHARVLQPDGRFAELDQKTVTDAPVKGDDTETYSSEHERRAPLPGLTVGSIVEETDVVDEKAPYFAAGSIFRFRFRNGVPTAYSRLTFDLPSAMPYKELVHNLPQAVVTRTEADGRKVVVYAVGKLEASHGSDIELSTNAPIAPMVEVATGDSWASVAGAYAAVADAQTVVEEARGILPENLPAGRVERIRAIVAKLHKEVRYTGVEFGAAKLTPEKPAEVIKRHYGDCKDKATLLVAMLRAAGIPANLALLSTGPGLDVNAMLPGMNEFDHAIVYVPAAGVDAAMWVDATAQYYVPGSLPFMDEGRMALVIAPETKGLTRTPDAKPEDSKLVETRVFTLSSHGPSQVTESSETQGIVDANYRSAYGGEDTKKIHETMEGYAKAAYLAKSLVKLNHGPADDLSQPFALTLEMSDAKRGTTAMDEAAVAIFPNMVVDSLPNWFKKTPAVVGPDTTVDAKHEMELAEASRAATYVFRPYEDERRVKILIPGGFAVRSLPPNKTTAIGSGTLEETYAAEPGVVTAVYKFNTGPGNLTAAQALAMRDAVLELGKRDYVGVSFDQIGAKELAAGQIRAALDSDRAMIEAHPKEGLPHVRLARALLAAGIGDEAHVEAKKATELEPKLAIAFDTLGWTLEHDALGERFGKGYDLPGAIAAYNKANALDTEENDSRFDLAILYEFDARGLRYAPDSDMAAAIAGYRELIERTKDSNPAAMAQYRDNLLYALLFAKHYKELDEMLAKVPFSNAHAALAITSAAAQHGAAAGIAQADKGNVAASDRSANLNTAGGDLARLRLYAEAAAVLQAGIGGGGDAAAAGRQIEMYKNLKPASLEPLALSDPAYPLQRVMFGEMAGTLTKKVAMESVSHSAYSSKASMERDSEKSLKSSGVLRGISAKSGIDEVVLMDLIAGTMTFTKTGDDASGYSLVMTSMGSEGQHFYSVLQDGVYRVVADDNGPREIGNEVLHAVERNDLKLAKGLLDWKRDLVHKGGGDDPLAGPLLPRFWTIDSSKPGANSPEAMKLAAFSLLAGSMDEQPYLAEIAAAREKASAAQQEDFDLLLANGALGAEQPAIALVAAKRLMQAEPDSMDALQLAGRSYGELNDSAAWLAMLAPRVAKKPKDRETLLQEAEAYEAASDFAKARVTRQMVLDSGKATAGDYNSFAWLGLFDNHVGEAELKAAQQSNMLSKNGSFGDLHTLACVYAAEGKTTEARQVLAQAISAGTETEPNSAVWYALGLIYEQYGATDAAMAAYRKVSAHDNDDHTFVEPTDTYVLAQARIRALGVAAK